MKILTLKDQEAVSNLFKELLQRKWKKTHVDTSVVDEYMRVTSFSLEKKAITKKDKKEVFDTSFDLVKQIAFYFLSKKQFFNPLVILSSVDTLFLCEVSQSSTYDAKKFSLIGKFAKKYKCFSAVFAGMSKENFEKKPTIVTVSMAYDESLTFRNGNDFLVEICMPEYENDKPLELFLVEFSLKDPIINAIVENIRKPDAELVSLGRVNFN